MSATFAAACWAADEMQARKPLDRAHRPGRAASSTVEALMWSLRQRGTAALKEPETRHRLAQLSEAQLIEVADRLQRLKPQIARAWSEQEIDRLIAWRTAC